MSRIGGKTINIPSGVTLSQNGDILSAKGPKGELSLTLPKAISLELNDTQASVKRLNNENQTKAFHGLVRSLLSNMITGVHVGFSKKLEMVGTGYRAKMEGKDLRVSAGYSHPVIVKAPAGITFAVENDTLITVSGADRRDVGQIAAEIRKIRKPEPYKGKGIKYQGEVIRRKAGKAAKVGSAS